MVFVGGPRQVGKTTLGKFLLTSSSGYLNWDVPEHREIILSRELPNTSPLLFDEIHKYRSWRNYLKGLQDLGQMELLALRLPRLVGSPLSINALR